MVIQMKREDFNSTPLVDLGWKCLEPIMIPLRGKSMEIKANIYQQLNQNQKALFMFYAFYNHAKNSLDEFYWWSLHFYSQPNSWSEIKTALLHLELTDIMELFVDIENIVKTNVQKFNEQESLKKLLEADGPAITQLFGRFNETIPQALTSIGEHIRNHPSDYVCFCAE
jgi:hypothetical protein